MANAADEYAKLISQFSVLTDTESGQMFGKACIKANGKAFVAQHKEWVVFKLAGEHHGKALGLAGVTLWDPSGKGRPMKEWVAVPATAHQHFLELARASYDYITASK